MREDEDVLRRKRVVLGFSCGRGARFAKARAERAFFGLLQWVNTVLMEMQCRIECLHLAEHLVGVR